MVQELAREGALIEVACWLLSVGLLTDVEQQVS